MLGTRSSADCTSWPTATTSASSEVPRSAPCAGRGSSRHAKAHILPAPVLLLGDEAALDPDRFVVERDRIHVLADRAPAGEVGVSHLLVPPILHSESTGCQHLMFGFFRNSWMVDHRQATVPIPRITGDGWADPEESAAWRRSVDKCLIDAEHPLPDSELLEGEEEEDD